MLDLFNFDAPVDEPLTQKLVKGLARGPDSFTVDLRRTIDPRPPPTG